MLLYSLLALYVALVGLVVGSYLNVVVYRLPRGLSTVLPRSRCPGCDAPVRAYDNVPILSFLLLRGRCRDCGVRISRRYPAIEAATAVLFLFALWRFGSSIETLAAMLFSALLLVLALVDYEHFVLPDVITLPGTAAGLGLSFVVDWTTPLGALAGAAIGAAVLLALIGAWYLVRKEQGMGWGDVKMLAMIGAFLGLDGVLVTLFVASLSGAATGVALMLGGQLSMKSKLQFGVFLALGGLVALFTGDRLLASYTSLL